MRPGTVNDPTVAAGLLRPDAGDVLVDGSSVLQTARAASERFLSLVHLDGLGR